MEQLFGARIGARIKQLFGARVRDSFSGPESGPESNNFSWPGALGCGCFSRGSLEAAVSICTFVSTSHLFGARMVYDFSGPESGTRMEQLFGARIGARIEQLFGARGSWLWMFLQGLFGCHCFNLHICVHQPSFRSPNGIRLFGARIRDPNGTAFRGPNRGPNRTTFRGPGLLAVDVSPGALWRPPFQSAHLCPPAIFSGPEWNDFLGPEPSARMVVFFLWCLNRILCASWTFLFFGDLKLDLPVVEPLDH